MEKNGSAVGAALINEFKQMVADGRLPQVDMSQFKNAEELAAYLVNAIKSGGEAVVNAVRTAVPHDPTKKAAAFMVTRKDGEQADGPDGEAEEPENDGDFGDSDPMEREDVRDALSKIDDQLDTAEKMYHGLVRERCFIHGVRDLPDMDNPDHLMSMVDVLNRLEDVGERICNVQRKLSVLGIVYGLGNNDAVDDLMDRMAKLADCVAPLATLFHDKLDTAVGTDWDPCLDDEDGEYDECDGCCGCCDENECDGSYCNCGGEDGENPPPPFPFPGMLIACVRTVKPDAPDAPAEHEGDGDPAPDEGTGE